MESEKNSGLPQYYNLDTSANFEKPIDVPVTGKIPSWVKGSLYRNGSGLYKIGDMSWKHVFDGFAVLHRWTIQDGKVTYLSTILDSKHYKKCVKLNRLVGVNFGSHFPDPCKSIFRRFFSYFLPTPPERSDNTAVSVVEMGDKLFAMTETPLINEIKPDSLLVEKKTDMSKIVAVHMGTARPHVDKDGTFYYYGTNMSFKKAYNFIRIPLQPEGGLKFAEAKIIATVPSRWKMNMGYTHSYGMTENYFVHFEQPLCINLPRLMTMGIRGVSVSDCFISYEGEPILIHVVNKKTGDEVPIQYEAPYGFVFHFVNCYEEAGFVICDVCLYDRGDIIKEMYLESVTSQGHLTATAEARLARFVLPLSIEEAEVGKNLVTLPSTSATAVLKEGTKGVLEVTSEVMLQDIIFELPRINYDFNGQRYRYAYGTTAIDNVKRQLMKFDLQEKTCKAWLCGPEHHPGEPVFVPRPGATEEDDGVILCPVLALTTEHSSYLVVLDTSTFTELGRATTPADVKMNLTFHGWFSEKVF